MDCEDGDVHNVSIDVGINKDITTVLLSQNVTLDPNLCNKDSDIPRSTVLSEKSETNSTNLEDNKNGGDKNTTTSNTVTEDKNKTIEMERIITPVRPPQKILEPVSSNSNISTKLEKANGISGKSIKEFRPSPQLDETPYEYNKFPVQPALPEAKHLSGFNIGEYDFRQPHRHSGPETNIPWPTKSPYPPVLTTEAPWVSRVKFPTTPPQTSREQVHHHHYLPPTASTNDYLPPHGNGNKYLPPTSSGGHHSGNIPPSGNDNRYLPPSGGGKDYLPPSGSKDYLPPSGGSDNYGSNKGEGRVPHRHWLDGPNYKPPHHGSVSNVPVTTSIGVWDKHNGPTYDRRPPISHKTQYDFTSYDGPYIEPTGGSKFDIGKPYIEPPISPWKKIIKILTAIIPIGLLISALTPTVITVTPMNDTQQMRLRTEDPSREAAKRLISSLAYFNKVNGERCEDRILCELLLSASNSKNAEENVKNLLNNFTEQDSNVAERADEMRKIFEAVRDEDCSPIICNTIKDT